MGSKGKWCIKCNPFVTSVCTVGEPGSGCEESAMPDAHSHPFSVYPVAMAGNLSSVDEVVASGYF